MKEVDTQSDICFLGYTFHSYFFLFILFLCTTSNFGKSRATDDAKSTEVHMKYFTCFPTGM